MTLEQSMPRGFVKHIVRRADIVARATTAAAHNATTSKAAHKIERTQTSSLEAPVVAILLGGFLGVFLLFVLIGITCKFANRPKTDARPQVHAKGMYQPSAAGYGSAAATLGPNYRNNQSMHDVSSPSVGLLDSASPMGHGGRYEEADSSLGSSNGMAGGNGQHGGFGMVPSHSAGSFSDEGNRFAPMRGGHARGASSGIELPASAAAGAFRRNVSGAHPPVHTPGDESYDSPQAGNGFAPDGSSFTPGQVFDHGAMNGGAPSREMRENRTSYLGAPPSVLPRRASLNQGPSHPQQRPYARGPPPSSSKNRRSRYAQGGMSSSGDTGGMRRSRIDSIGPGTYRKSMFLPEDQDAMPGSGLACGSSMRRTTSNNNGGPGALRRVESIGKGDPRRASRYNPNKRTSKVHSIVIPDDEDFAPVQASAGYRDGLPGTSNDGLLPTHGGWDGGRHSPYGSSNGSNSPLGPLGPNDSMLQQQQQPPQQNGGGVRMMQYGAGFGAPMPKPGMATTQMSTPSSFVPAAPLGAGLGRGMESHAASRQIL